jgi:PAS domain S-box-containing protein
MQSSDEKQQAGPQTEAPPPVNVGVQDKVEPASLSHRDLENLTIDGEIAMLLLDGDLCIQGYTPGATNLFGLTPGDRGHQIGQLRTHLQYPRLEEDAGMALTDGVTIRRQIQNDDGRWLMVSLCPYSTGENHIEGVMISFVDMTAHKESEQALRDAKEFAESIIHTIPDSLLVLQADLRIQMANETFYQTFGLQPAEVEGRLIYELSNGQWDIPTLHMLLEEILPDNHVFLGYEVDREFESMGRRTLLVNGRRLDPVQLILLSIADITVRKRAEEALRQNQARQGFLIELRDKLRDLSDPYEIMGVATEMLARHLGVAVVYYALVEADQESAKIVAAYNDGRLPSVAPGYRFRLDDHGVGWGSALRAGEEVFSRENELGTRGLFGEASPSAGVYAGTAIPLLVDGCLVAWLSVAHPEPRLWREEERRLQREVAELTWAVVERARAQAAMRESQEKYRTLFSTMEEGFCILQMIFDEEQKPIDYRYIEINPAFEQQTGMKDAIGRTIRELVPDIEPFWFDIYGKVALTGEPTRFVDYAKSMGRWFDVCAFRIDEAEKGHVAVLFNDITKLKEAQFAEMRQHILQGQERERSHLALEIHDGPMQELTALTFELVALYEQLQDEALKAALAVINAKIEQNIRLLRHIMVTLRPPAVVDFGLVAAFESYALEFRRQQAEPTLYLALDEKFPHLPEEIVLSLYRIYQQALYNIVQHAKAAQVWVRLQVQDHLLVLEVEDDGLGFEVPKDLVDLSRRRHLGIVGMSERAKAIGGELEVHSAPGQGTRVQVVIPVLEG